MTSTAGTPDAAEELADQAAPLDALLVDAALGTLRRFVPDASAARLAVSLVPRPLTTGRRPGGLNIARGGLSFLRDLASRPRIPEMVDRSAFEVGRNIAVTPGEVVLRTEVLELIQYRPQTEQVKQVPLLIVPPTINKFYALDLAQGRSMIEYLVRGGQQVFVLSWRNPDARHAGWGLDAYVQAVRDALGAVERVCGVGRTALMGVCAGGIIASITAAHLAAIGQQDRLACFRLPLTVLDTANAVTLGALVDPRP